MSNFYIVIIGNITTGKTFLSKKISEKLYFDYYPEPDGIFNLEFHQDMKKWAFQNQLDYLIRTINYEIMINRSPKPAVQDRFSLEVLNAFSKALYFLNIINKKEFTCLEKVHTVFESLINQKPQILIYLESPVEILYSRLRKRSRVQDSLITKRFLETLQKCYDDWIPTLEQYDLIKWNTFKKDIVENKKNLEELISIISKKRHNINYSI